MKLKKHSCMSLPVAFYSVWLIWTFCLTYMTVFFANRLFIPDSYWEWVIALCACLYLFSFIGLITLGVLDRVAHPSLKKPLS